MPAIKYLEKNLTAARRRTIAQANAICAEYADAGLSLTLRQLFYQFVARDLIANSQAEYKRLGDILNDARMCGLMDWDYLVDRTRNLVSLPHWGSPAEIIDSAASGFRRDVWADQGKRVEVWIEKDAGIGVIEGVCQTNHVPYFSCRGYTSVSEIWAAAQRLGRYRRHGADVTILHIGDHDPSGIDMTRDVEDRLRNFMATDDTQQLIRRVVHPILDRLDLASGKELRYGHPAEWEKALAEVERQRGAFGSFSMRRIALNYDQVQQYNPPPNPAKTTDARFLSYVRATGLDESWELDALDPRVLQNLIQAEVDAVRDAGTWESSVDVQERERELLRAVSDHWSDVVDYLAS